MRLHLVRHGRPVIDRATPSRSWSLDPAGYDDVWALRERLPQAAAWYTSPEPASVETAQLLTDTRVGVVDGLRGQHQEPPAATRERVAAAVRPILAAEVGRDVVLVGHGTVWTLLVA